MFSSSVIFVLTVGKGTHGFTLDPRLGEFVLTHPDLKIPDPGQASRNTHKLLTLAYDECLLPPRADDRLAASRPL